MPALDPYRFYEVYDRKGRLIFLASNVLLACRVLCSRDRQGTIKGGPYGVEFGGYSEALSMLSNPSIWQNEKVKIRELSPS